MSLEIDFVIPWVDGADERWINCKKKYSPENKGTSNADHRYRDWNLLRYWFRSVEKFAPWVRKVHFITWGHVPSWLDTQHRKLNIVNHKDFIPDRYLPTFSSHTIELNIHRIEGLSEHFVYFNDDMFLTRKCFASSFFHDELPRDIAALNVHCYALSMLIQMVCIRNTGVINDHFDFKRAISSNKRLWLRPSYGKPLLRTLALWHCPRFPGFFMHHGPQPYQKSTFFTVWDAEPQVLEETCCHKFREMTDVNQWVMKVWQLASGSFAPQRGGFYSLIPLGIGDPLLAATKAASIIEHGTATALCINDGKMDKQSFESCQAIITGAFEKVLNVKSSFELTDRNE